MKRTASLKIISLGWGIQSWTLAAMVAVKELPPVDYAVFADTTHESQATYAHAKKWTPWLEERGLKVMTVKGANTEVVHEELSNSVTIPAFTIDTNTGKHGQMRRQCTHQWKIMPIRRFIRSIISNPKPGQVEMWMGISLDEWHRMRTSDVAYINNIYPLVDRRITRNDCKAWLLANRLSVPPKSACIFCPYKSINAWKELKRVGSPDWQEALEVDRILRSKRPLHTLFIHPARVPLTEAVQIPDDIEAKQLALEIPCNGGICFV